MDGFTKKKLTLEKEMFSQKVACGGDFVKVVYQVRKKKILQGHRDRAISETMESTIIINTKSHHAKKGGQKHRHRKKG